MAKRRAPQISLGLAVHERRVVLRLTVAQLANRADMTRSHLARLEAGEVNPSYETLLRLAHALVLPLSELVKDSERIEQEPGPGAPAPVR